MILYRLAESLVSQSHWNVFGLQLVDSLYLMYWTGGGFFRAVLTPRISGHNPPFFFSPQSPASDRMSPMDCDKMSQCRILNRMLVYHSFSIVYIRYIIFHSAIICCSYQPLRMSYQPIPEDGLLSNVPLVVLRALLRWVGQPSGQRPPAAAKFVGFPTWENNRKALRAKMIQHQFI